MNADSSREEASSLGRTVGLRTMTYLGGLTKNIWLHIWKILGHLLFTLILAKELHFFCVIYHIKIFWWKSPASFSFFLTDDNLVSKSDRLNISHAKWSPFIEWLHRVGRYVLRARILCHLDVLTEPFSL